MDPDRYCLDAAAPPGSALYYATLFTGARERAALVSVHALRHVLLDIVETIADANVRAPKLNWWSGEIMDARDGSPHHPVALAITRNCGRPLWRHPEVFAMLAAVARVSAGGGIASEAARGEFCADVGGGTAGLCMAAVGFEAGGDGRERVRALGAALEGAMLASVPSVRSGLRRLPIPAPDSAGRGRSRPFRLRSGADRRGARPRPPGPRRRGPRRTAAFRTGRARLPHARARPACGAGEGASEAGRKGASRRVGLPGPQAVDCVARVTWRRACRTCRACRSAGVRRYRR